MTGIITALREDYRLLKSRCHIDDSILIAGKRFFSGVLDEQPVAFVRPEMPPADIAAVTQAMIDHFAISSLVFTGAALPLVPFLEAGDLIIANHYLAPNETDISGRPVMYEASDTVLDFLRTLTLSDEGKKMQIVFGAIMGSTAEADDLVRLAGIRESGGMAADRAGHAFAYVCHINKINFAAFSVIAGDGDSLETIPAAAIETLHFLRRRVIAETAFVSNPASFI